MIEMVWNIMLKRSNQFNKYVLSTYCVLDTALKSDSQITPYKLNDFFFFLVLDFEPRGT